jgi:hypothetical protein
MTHQSQEEAEVHIYSNDVLTDQSYLAIVLFSYGSSGMLPLQWYSLAGLYNSERCATLSLRCDNPETGVSHRVPRYIHDRTATQAVCMQQCSVLFVLCATILTLASTATQQLCSLR